MSFPRAKPLSQLYDEVEDYDLVIVPDPPLASALNRQLDRPHLGQFVVTPRRLAAQRREAAEDRLAFLKLRDSTDLEWKAAADAVGNILQCWEYQTTLESVLDYPRYADSATETAVDVIRDLDTTSHQLTAYQLDDEQDVAVVGADQLTPLEQTILPAAYDEFDPFLDASFDLPTFHCFDSKHEIVQTVLDGIEATDPESVGIVLDQASEYSALVESALAAADIPFIGGPGFTDDTDVRAFLSLLRTGFSGSDTRVAEVRPTLTRLGADVPVGHDEQLLRELDTDAVRWVLDFCDTLGESTFEDALTAYEAHVSADLETLETELDALSIADEQITEAGVDRLEFYLQTYEVPVDREDGGVLLADAKPAGHVDRPIVFYLGLDEGWTHSAPRRPWVDTDAEFTRNITQFQRLLQNGTDQYYLVQDAAGGDPVTPCLYFDDLLDADFERFSDLPHETHTLHPDVDDDESAFEHVPLAVESTEIDTISQSSLNSYVNCPRDYLFGRLVDGPDKDYFLEGNLFHDFAEFYVNHPEFVDDAVIDEVVDLMCEETRSFVRSVERDLRRTKYRVGVETIVEYLDANPPVHPEGDAAGDSWGNFFADYFDRDITSAITEEWFSDVDLGVKGKIDLRHDPTHLLDYKSGRKKRASQIVSGSAIDPPSETPNFQAALYLAYHRRREPDDELQFTFLHFLETLDDAVTGDADLSDIETTVTYYPIRFAEFVGGRRAHAMLCDHYNDCTGTFDALGYDAYLDIQTGLQFPATRDKDELRDSAYAASFEAAVTEAVGDIDADVAKGCDQAIRKLNSVRRRNYFLDDLDDLERFVDERIAELNARRRGEERFPVHDFENEPNYRRVDHRDMLLEGGR